MSADLDRTSRLILIQHRANLDNDLMTFSNGLAGIAPQEFAVSSKVLIQISRYLQSSVLQFAGVWMKNPEMAT